MALNLLRAGKETKSAVRVWMARTVSCLIRSYSQVVSPISTDEDARRKEYILNILLLLSIAILTVLGATLVWNYISKEYYAGMSPLLFAMILLAYGLMYAGSKCGYAKQVSVLIIAIEICSAISIGWHWGASLPATLLITVLSIVTTSVLIGSTAGFIISGLMIAVLTILGTHEAVSLHVPLWRYDRINVTDVITYSILFLFISLIAWISNREIDRSLTKARHSESELERERNVLEQRISERTKELIAKQESILAEHDHSIRVGELSKGIIHDIINPLTGITMQAEQLASDTKDLTTIRIAIDAAKRLRKFITSVQKHIDPLKIQERSTAYILDETNAVRDILGYKARASEVSLNIDVPEDLKAHCCPLKIYRVLLNLASNAIDACVRSEKNDKRVLIKAYRSDDSIVIEIEDNGCGMTEEGIPKDTIGLNTVSSIITKELSGNMQIKSKLSIGTTFIITIPATKNAT